MGRGADSAGSSAAGPALLTRVRRGVASSHPYPRPQVALNFTGPDGNAMMLVAQVSKALKQTPGAGRKAADRFIREATSDDYGYLLRTIDRYADVVSSERV